MDSFKGLANPRTLLDKIAQWSTHRLGIRFPRDNDFGLHSAPGILKLRGETMLHPVLGSDTHPNAPLNRVCRAQAGCVFSYRCKILVSGPLNVPSFELSELLGRQLIATYEIRCVG